MSKRPPRDFLMMNIAKADPRQVLLAKYLRETGKIASQLMGAADAHFYSYALGIDRSNSNPAVELAMSESVLALSGQIHRVLNFHRIDRGIILPNEFLSRCGLALGSSPSAVVSQERSVVTLPSAIPKVDLPVPEPVSSSPASAFVEHGNDVEGNEVKRGGGIKIGGMNASQSVADFLNGTNGR